MNYRKYTNDLDGALDYDRRVAQAMRILSTALPAVVCVAAIVNVFAYGFATNILGLEASCVVGSAMVARYFHQRSRNKETVFGTARVIPSGTEFEVDPIDYVVMVLAASLIVVSAFPTVFELFR